MSRFEHTYLRLGHLHHCSGEMIGVRQLATFAHHGLYCHTSHAHDGTRTRAVAKREHISFCNSRGFAALPIELLHNVVSYLQEPSIPHRCEYAIASVYRERRDVLLALCQLCRSLRVDLLPLLWERLEACARPVRTDVKRAEVLGRELIRQLRLVTDRKKSYASYVRCDPSNDPVHAFTS